MGIATDPQQLAEQAQRLLGKIDGVGVTAIEEDLRRAYQQVADDLATVARLQREKQPVPYAALFSTLYHEKVAALLFITRHTLLDLAHCAASTLDIQYARHNLSLYLDTLAHLNAMQALEALYDFAHAHLTGMSKKFWRYVCQRCLELLAARQEYHPQFAAFLVARPPAQRQLEQLLTEQPEFAQQFSLLPALPQPAPVQYKPYMRLYAQLEKGLPYDKAVGACAVVAAQHHIHQVAEAGDLSRVLQWYAGGSPAAAREVLRHTRSLLPARQYAEFLDQVLQVFELPIVRKAAVVLELGNLNRAERPDGGDAEINRVLLETAMCAPEDDTALARLAVQQLAMVANEVGLLYIIEQAPLLPVAEEAVMAMRDLRRLLLVEPYLDRRPALQHAYQTAHQQLLEIQNLVDAVWVAVNEDVVEGYLSRLRALHAFPELRKLSSLIERTSPLTPHTAAGLPRQLMATRG